MKSIVRFSAALMPIVLVGIASAQTSGLTVRLGGLYPNSKVVRDNVSKSGIAFGFDLMASRPCKYIPGSQSWTLDFNRTIGKESRLDTWSLGYLTRFPLSLMGGKFYGGVGGGIAYNAIWGGNTVDQKQVVSSNGSNFNGNRFGNQVFTGTALIGTQFRSNMTLELQYRHVGKIEGVDPSTLGFFLGYKF